MYSLIIIGAGVAGLTASIYASRYKINHLVFGETPGGQGMLAGTVENYPGYASVSGAELMEKFVGQAESYGVKIIQKQIDRLAKIDDGFEVAAEEERWQTKSLILAIGASFRHLGIPGEEELIGRGVSFCTSCDAPLFKDKVVAVVGGGDSAVTGAIHAAAFAQKVFIIHRRDEYRAEPTWVERLRKNKKIEEILSNEVKEILGVSDKKLVTQRTQNSAVGRDTQSTEKVGGLVLEKSYRGSSVLPVDGVFIEIGQVPSSALAKQLGVELDGRGYVRVTPAMATNVPGVFAAGDLAAVEGGVLFRQFVTAAADGARAAAGVYQYLHQGTTPAPLWGKKKSTISAIA